jgi:hypothetical protein
LPGMLLPVGGVPYEGEPMPSACCGLSRVITRVAATVRISRALKATVVNHDAHFAVIRRHGRAAATR